jgi:hypothetical protein
MSSCTPKKKKKEKKARISLVARLPVSNKNKVIRGSSFRHSCPFGSAKKKKIK